MPGLLSAARRQTDKFTLPVSALLLPLAQNRRLLAPYPSIFLATLPPPDLFVLFPLSRREFYPRSLSPRRGLSSSSSSRLRSRDRFAILSFHHGPCPRRALAEEISLNSPFTYHRRQPKVSAARVRTLCGAVVEALVAAGKARPRCSFERSSGLERGIDPSYPRNSKPATGRDEDALLGVIRFDPKCSTVFGTYGTCWKYLLPLTPQSHVLRNNLHNNSMIDRVVGIQLISSKTRWN